jgi:hypothetical protein
MKKFLITLLILIILGGAVFYFGWVQLQVPPGSYGVIISKTHGVDPLPVQSGEFRWVWYKLIPTNAQVVVFRLETVKVPVDFNSFLPSGDSYASFAGLASTDFSWYLKGNISFNINPDYIIPLFTQHNLTDQGTLDALLNDMAQEIKVIILSTLSSIDNQRLEKILSGNPDEQMEAEIRSRFPMIMAYSFVITSARFPDFTLYRYVSLLYEEFLDRQREYVTAGFARRAENHIETQLRFAELERYGELFTKYPILLEYLSLNLDKE